ncbi:thiamine-phosphate kinase [Dasania sp. GY-MA-18]|uniref:Thiamine-monophosphate kinase n=1 Tax=Dasania phycosphaerae TaxID=2950436 RepID=A0A9J6RIZ8_9GAMM|nr:MULTISPECIES: thiamine-phosphate kinase [Dasania]MCR8921521.1 thiamine-phosphate kinase [Dasania sp. GY-MA-18]MCZ0863949.1 thiamine-phosphate kinase [Dasania phycosphaerae]MCZ0867677.1 thiamine-phosphate kinase [Dasania phycosphaerae]
MSLSEFSLIERYFTALEQPASPYVDFAIGDDCCLLSIPDDMQLAQSIDTLNANVHFPAEANADLIAQRALAVSISDLAAMGASPVAFSLAISMPQVSEPWLADFSRGLQQAAQHYAIALIGGDTTKGPLSLTVHVQGVVAKGKALQRHGAALGDCVFVTGSLGDAAAALAFMQGQLSVAKSAQQFFKQRYYQPSARIAVGQSLNDIATAAIDVSDGLVADLGHIAKRSGVAAVVNVDKLPLSAELQAASSPEQARRYALSGGDDYELCFTAPASMREQLLELSELIDVAITEVGTIVAGSGVRCVDGRGSELQLSQTGYQHF